MNARTRIILTVSIIIVALLVGCSTPEPVIETVVVTSAPEIIEVPTEAPTEEPTLAPASPGETSSGGNALPAPSYRPNRLIVKDAQLQLEVSDTDLAIDGTTQVVGDVGGYIISSRVWYQDWLGNSYKYATITMGVPVDQFERAMRRLRGLAVRVIDETASGQDVTDEYVDLQSRLGNLEATRDRIRGFLDQTQSIDEALQVNEELSTIEAQIEQVQGRMNYLFDRAGYSTITAQIEPELPTLTPTPAPPWSPAQTVQQAGQTLGSILRVATELAIWLAIVAVPLVAPPALIVWGVGRRIKRRKASSGHSASCPSK